MMRFILHLDKRESITFVCENATKCDVDVIAFEWSLYEIYGKNSHLYVPHPSIFSFHDRFKYTNGYFNGIIYQIDVNSQCMLPYVAQARYSVWFESRHPATSPVTRIPWHLTSHDKWQLPPATFDFTSLIPLLYGHGLPN